LLAFKGLLTSSESLSEFFTQILGFFKPECHSHNFVLLVSAIQALGFIFFFSPSEITSHFKQVSYREMCDICMTSFERGHV